MASVLDAAAYILKKAGPMSAMKLQKLVYYSQAWATVWDDEEIFPEQIEAWKNGPVAPTLWRAHQGKFRVDAIPGGRPSQLKDNHKETIKAVLKFYGGRSAQWLSDLTHMEDPWKDAYAKGQNSVIPLEAMSEYYSSIRPGAGARV